MVSGNFKLRNYNLQCLHTVKQITKVKVIQITRSAFNNPPPPQKNTLQNELKAMEGLGDKWTK